MFNSIRITASMVLDVEKCLKFVRITFWSMIKLFTLYKRFRGLYFGVLLMHCVDMFNSISINNVD